MLLVADSVRKQLHSAAFAHLLLLGDACEVHLGYTPCRYTIT